jgi:hypothetical protein
MYYNLSLFIISLVILFANKTISQPVVDIGQITYRELCELTKKPDLPDLIELELQKREDPCASCVVDKKVDTKPLPSPKISEEKIDIRGDKAIGGLTYVNYQYENKLERIDFTVDFKKFDKSQNIYIQFYQSQIGDNGFYFGIQNRVLENDQLLIFSMWFNSLDVAQSVGILDAAECAHFKEMRYDQKIKVFELFFKVYPDKYKEYKEYALNSVRANSDLGGYVRSSTNELSYVGIRLPNFNISQGDKYIFSVVKESDTPEGTWYQYLVKNLKTEKVFNVGSVRFKPNAKINKYGTTWVEIFSPLKQKVKRPCECQYYEDLPEIDVTILPIGDMQHPKNLKLSYGRNKSRIPQQNVDFFPQQKQFNIQVGPDIERRTEEQVYNY